MGALFHLAEVVSRVEAPRETYPTLALAWAGLDRDYRAVYADRDERDPALWHVFTVEGRVLKLRRVDPDAKPARILRAP